MSIRFKCLRCGGTLVVEDRHQGKKARCPGCHKLMSVPACDYYELLQVSANAESDVIQAAYKRLAIKWHPDKNPGDCASGEQMKLLNQAYEALSDPQTRKQYDALRKASSESFVVDNPIVGRSRDQANGSAARCRRQEIIETWYALSDGVEVGPFSHEQLRRAAAFGKIRQDDQLRMAGERYWVAASKLPWLADCLTPPPSCMNMPLSDPPTAAYHQRAHHRDALLCTLAAAIIVCMPLIIAFLYYRT